jgi:hypothetical protein
LDKYDAPVLARSYHRSDKTLNSLCVLSIYSGALKEFSSALGTFRSIVLFLKLNSGHEVYAKFAFWTIPISSIDSFSKD